MEAQGYGIGSGVGSSTGSEPEESEEFLFLRILSLPSCRFTLDQNFLPIPTPLPLHQDLDYASSDESGCIQTTFILVTLLLMVKGLSGVQLTGELVENRSFSNQSQSRKS